MAKFVIKNYAIIGFDLEKNLKIISESYNDMNDWTKEFVLDLLVALDRFLFFWNSTRISTAIWIKVIPICKTRIRMIRFRRVRERKEILENILFFSMCVSPISKYWLIRYLTFFSAHIVCHWSFEFMMFFLFRYRWEQHLTVLRRSFVISTAIFFCHSNGIIPFMREKLIEKHLLLQNIWNLVDLTISWKYLRREIFVVSISNVINRWKEISCLSWSTYC